MNIKDDYKEKTKRVFEKLDIEYAYAYPDGTVKIHYNDKTEEEMSEMEWLKLYQKTLKDIDMSPQEKREQFFTDIEEK